MSEQPAITPAAWQDGSPLSTALSAESLHRRAEAQLSRSATRPALDRTRTDTGGRASSPAGRDAAKRAAKSSDKSSRSDKSRAGSGVDVNRRGDTPQPPADRGWVMPTSGFTISSRFGEAGPYWASGYHTGIDFATDHGTPAAAVSNGTVVQAGWDGAYGNHVRLRLENGDEVSYSHLSSIAVVDGERVSTGQRVGRVGETGNAYGAHLHFEYRLAGNLDEAVNPRPRLAEQGVAL